MTSKRHLLDMHMCKRTHSWKREKVQVQWISDGDGERQKLAVREWLLGYFCFVEPDWSIAHYMDGMVGCHQRQSEAGCLHFVLVMFRHSLNVSVDNWLMLETAWLRCHRQHCWIKRQLVGRLVLVMSASLPLCYTYTSFITRKIIRLEYYLCYILYNFIFCLAVAVRK